MTVVELSARLDDDGIAHAVIGALALAVHGVVRASDDADVLVVDRRCLDAATWDEVRASGTAVEVRRGDADDPLAGVVRMTPPGDTRIDIIVGGARWQADVLARAERRTLLGGSVPVAVPVDVVLLKLYAGGPQDAWDVDQLLDAIPALASQVPAALSVLPPECEQLWQRIVAGRPSSG